MKRRWIPLDKLEIYDEMHQLQPDGSFMVDEAKDGQDTQKHIEGIEYIKGVLNDGQKIRPVLVQDNEDGTYTRLDGFKRCIAHKALGYTMVEAFVCSPEEVRRRDEVPYHEGTMWCGKGGQMKEQYGLFEGSAQEDIILYWSGDPQKLRIEIAENVQVHWGSYGRYRLSLGRDEFLQLAEAITSIE